MFSMSIDLANQNQAFNDPGQIYVGKIARHIQTDGWPGSQNQYPGTLETPRTSGSPGAPELMVPHGPMFL